jgi:hypothetical protein
MPPRVAASGQLIAAADSRLLQETMLAVVLEATVSSNEDGSGTGCWILDSAGVTRLRERHGNFSFARRGGTQGTPYYSARLVGASGSSLFYLIHHISTVSTGVNNQFVTNSDLDVSHLCPSTECWNPFHMVCEAREVNISRRGCNGDIIDRDGCTVHVCPHPVKKCIGTQNVRLSSVIELENVRRINSIMRLKELVVSLAHHLGIANIHTWSMRSSTNTRAFHSQYSHMYEQMTERILRGERDWEHDIIAPDV